MTAALITTKFSIYGYYFIIVLSVNINFRRVWNRQMWLVFLVQSVNWTYPKICLCNIHYCNFGSIIRTSLTQSNTTRENLFSTVYYLLACLFICFNQISIIFLISTNHSTENPGPDLYRVAHLWPH